VLIDRAPREIGRLNVYRRVAVSWYGPGLYGNKLSCGGRLTPGTLGVAHKTLPCGAHVTLRRGTGWCACGSSTAAPTSAAGSST
jgi:hypothetical protein